MVADDPLWGPLKRSIFFQIIRMFLVHPACTMPKLTFKIRSLVKSSALTVLLTILVSNWTSIFQLYRTHRNTLGSFCSSLFTIPAVSCSVPLP
uniref:Uncharacterized protein n=1 Tax=Haplochromis burtoni TaxID=8153 RepID=A0A3Q2X3L5_HAPBU